MLKYFNQYKFKDIREMFRNGNSDPLVCGKRCDGTYVAISGATAGIGRETAITYAKMGARLLLINRNKEKSEELCRELLENYGTDCSFLIADFSHLDQVKEIARIILDGDDLPEIFIHNAGVFHTKLEFTEDGLESVFQINFLGTFTLSYLLRDAYKRKGIGRIIYVNSEGHRFALSGVHLDDLAWKRHRYTGLKSYGAAKTAQLLTMMEFDDFFRGSGVTIIAMHPGNVATQIGDDNDEKYLRYKMKFITPKTRSPEISGTALYYLGISDEVKTKSGLFYSLTTEELPAPHGRDKDMAPLVFEKSLELAGLL